MFKVGRYTAALLIITSGILLFFNQMNEQDYTSLLIKWWPVFIVALGVEYILLSIIARSGERKVRFDFWSLFLSVMISIVVIGVTYGFQNLSWPFGKENENWHKYDRATISQSVGTSTEIITIDNVNGNVTLKEGNVQQLEIESVVWVSNKVNKDKADEIAEESTIEIKQGNELLIEAKGKKHFVYGIRQSPRVHLTIIVPKDVNVDFKIKLINGNIDVEQLQAKNEITLETINGAIQAAKIVGDLEVESVNGRINVNDIDGDVELNAVNGKIAASKVKGELFIETTNGDIKANDVEQELEVQTTNGKIAITNANSDLKVDTTNGPIVVSSSIRGDWNLDTTNGDIELTLPKDSHFEISGKSKKISNVINFPIVQENKKLSGKVGKGTYSLHIDTNKTVEFHDRD